MNGIGKNRLEFLVMVAIILIAAFLRLYRLPEYMTFLGDEGRDAIVVKKMVTEFDLPFIGPQTSIGNMYLGPLYYYMMAVPFVVSGLNPSSAGYMVAILGILSVFLVYYLARQWFGRLAAFVASLLFAVSPVAVYYSRSSWNPNPAPFFTLLAVFALFKARAGNFRWFILVGVALAFVVQMHYLALILLPVFFALWLYELYLFKGGVMRQYFWGSTLLAIVAFFVLMSPLLIFDLKHDFMNFKAVSTFFADRQTTVNLNIFNTLKRIVPIFQYNLVEHYLGANNAALSLQISWVLFLSLLVNLFLCVKTSKLFWPFFCLSVWVIGGVLGLSLYKQTIYDHYLGFLSPAPFILLGSLVYYQNYFKNVFLKRLLSYSLVLITLLLVFVNLQINPVLATPNNQLKRTQDIAKFIIDKSAGQPFNFALLAKHNYDDAYEFYLDLYGHTPKLVPFEVTRQLFVVCEDPVCKPVGHSKYEIAAFGWAKIETEQDFAGVKVFKLVSNPTGEPQ